MYSSAVFHGIVRCVAHLYGWYIGQLFEPLSGGLKAYQENIPCGLFPQGRFANPAATKKIELLFDFLHSLC